MKILIIPSATLINDDLKQQFGNIPTVLTPINGETILEKLYNQYKDYMDYILVVGKEKSSQIDYLIKSKKLDIKLVEIDEVKDLGYSVLKALDFIKEEVNIEAIENIVINLGDTIVEDIDINTLDDVVLYSKIEDTARWTIFEHDGKKIIKILDKQYVSDEDKKHNAFIGVYSFTDIIKLYECLKKAVNTNDNLKNSFYEMILKYGLENSINILFTDRWLDLGHFDKYISSKKDIQARYFNSIKIDKKRGILKKTSIDTKKFQNEILWYLKLPRNLQYMTPRIIDYSLAYDEMSVTMEYYGYPTISELFVFGDLELSEWKKIFESIFMVIKDMSNYSVKDNEINSSLDTMYLGKTIERLQLLKKDNNFKLFFDNEIYINGEKYKGISYYLNRLPELIENYRVRDISSFNIIHGDLCFANILYDLQTGLVRLIDPRGTFGNYDIYGDTRYDLAKLSHSVNGKYDYIIHDLFDLNVNNNHVNYSLNIDESKKDIEKLFEKLIHQYGYDYKQIRLIEGTLFLSMIPLHKDNINRQYAMMATGIKILEELIRALEGDRQ